MLTAIREKTHGIIAGFIITLIIIPFALWGTYSYFSGGSALNVAEVEGIEVSQNAYRFALDRVLARAPNPALLDTPEFKRQVLDSLIDETLVIENATVQGYRISDAELGRLIRESPDFQVGGRFNPELYDRRLRREGVNQQTFEERLRTSQINVQIQSGFTESALVLPTEKAALLRLWQEKRDFDYIVVRPNRFMSRIRISDDDVKGYYESYPDRFKTPEQVRIEYIQLSAAELGAAYHPSEAELRRAYQDEISLYATPEKRRTSHILIELPASASEEDAKQALEKARGIAQKLRAGADFAALAKEHSADTGTVAKGGDLGYVERGTLPEELEKVMFELKPGAISEPVRTSYGYHIAKLTEYTPSSQKPFAEARGDIEKVLRQRKGDEEFFEKFEEMSNLVYEEPDSLAPAAQRLGLKVMQSEWFGRERGAGIAGQPKVVQAAFSPEVLQESRNSDVVEIDQETLVALRVVGHREAERKPLEEVRGEITALLRKEKAREQATTLGAELAKKLRAGERLDALAQARGLKTEQAKSVTRLDLGGVDGRIVTAVFKARRPTAGEASFGEVDLGDNGYAVFALEHVEQGASETADESLKRRVDNVLSQRRGTSVFASYVERLRKTADIKVHVDRL